MTGIRFYKAAGNTGTHSGSLWTAGGTRLAQATFQNESASGWQHVTFSSPVAVSANTTYVASYFAPAGHYSVTSGGFSSAVDNPPLHAAGQRDQRERRLRLRRREQLPDLELGRLQLRRRCPVRGRGRTGPGDRRRPRRRASRPATVNWTAPASGGPVTSYKITPYIGAAAQTAKTITGSPPATSTTVTGLTGGTAYTFRVQASNPSGSGPESSPSNSVTPQSSGAPSAPTAVTAQGDSTSAIVRWTAPGNDGGSPITGYTVTPSAGAPRAGPAGATNARVTGLTNGTAHTFTVTATNASGTSPASGASNAVTPRASLLRARHPDDGRRW